MTQERRVLLYHYTAIDWRFVETDILKITSYVIEWVSHPAFRTETFFGKRPLYMTVVNLCLVCMSTATAGDRNCQTGHRFPIQIFHFFSSFFYFEKYVELIRQCQVVPTTKPIPIVFFKWKTKGQPLRSVFTQVGV